MAASGAVVFQWLERIGLGYAIDNFKAAGITVPQVLMKLQKEECDALGVKSEGA
jgi:hypothetical protein